MDSPKNKLAKEMLNFRFYSAKNIKMGMIEFL